MTGKGFVKWLKSHGWELNRINGSHHIMIKENRTLSVPVHGNRDLPAGLLNRLMKDGGLK